MAGTGHFWAILLAGGDGRRVGSLTIDEAGRALPKQYCTFGTGRSLLRSAWARADHIVEGNRVVTVVAEQHRGLWERELSDFPAGNILVQPENRGTAAGILLPLLEIRLHRDAFAKLLILPSDHYVEDEQTLREALVEAVQEVQRNDGRMVALGMEARDIDEDYGFIVSYLNGKGPIRDVASFVEKPDRDTARRLRRRGGLVNSFILVAEAQTLLGAYETALPDLLEVFVDHFTRRGAKNLRELYEKIPTVDFSRDVLERTTDRLSVLPVPPCGWCDLGTPKRLASFLGNHRPRMAPKHVWTHHSSMS